MYVVFNEKYLVFQMFILDEAFMRSQAGVTEKPTTTTTTTTIDPLVNGLVADLNVDRTGEDSIPDRKTLNGPLV